MMIDLNRRAAIGMLWAFGTSQRGRSNPTRQLYAIAASPQPQRAQGIPGVLAAIAAAAPRVDWASALVPPNPGVDYVLFSFGQRVAVLGATAGDAHRVAVISFDEPGEPRIVEVELQGMSVTSQGRHLVRMDGHIHLALGLFGNGKRRFVAVRLSDLRVTEASASELYREFAIDGFVGGITSNNDFAFFKQPLGSRRLRVSQFTPGFPSSIELPPGLRLSTAADSRTGLYAANKDVMVFCPVRRDLPKGSDATTPLHILDRSSATWHSIEIPGGTSLIRAFGPWLAGQIRYLQDKYSPSPGAETRRQSNGAIGPGYDTRAEIFRLWQPGLVWLYHVPTKRTVVEETGQGDTEVVRVEDSQVLYRCDRALYEARLDGTRFVDQRKLLERDFVADIHWVFHGPPSEPPPNPPWTPFDLEG